MSTFASHASVAGFATALALSTVQTAEAQAVAVQQPVVRTFGVGTTVSVPDRGTIHLGGVNSAASGRVSSGLFRPGTNSGLERTGTSLSTTVFIHDLQAMDEALLAEGTSTSPEGEVWSARLNQRRNRDAHGTTSLTKQDRTPNFARYEQFAREAESRRKFALARLHWQTAAKLGSPIAAQHLAQLQP